MEERPARTPRPILGLFGLVTLPVVVGEMSWRFGLDQLPKIGPFAGRYIEAYLTYRGWIIDHWLVALLVAALGAVLLALLLRFALVAWHNGVVARLSGTRLVAEDAGFRKRRFDLETELAGVPAGHYFLGRDPRGRPVYLTEEDLETHGHIMGHTGSGKTRSVLEPLMFQDLRAGKGLVFLDAKGSGENVQMFKALTAITGRRRDLRILALAAPDWSHTYNPVHLGKGGDPLAAAERVFSVFPMEHEYYRGQAKLFFYNLIRVMAGTGKPFNLRDARLCVADDDVLCHMMDRSDERTAKAEIKRQLEQLGRDRQQTFTGLYNALAEYDHPLLNAYNPDIVIEDVIEKRQAVYFNLPANRYALLAPAIGKIVLQHIKAVASLRQLDRDAHDQHPFAVCVDELNRFADEELVPALNMLRDAHVQFRLSHQSIGDLEQVSDVFALQVSDNTRWKIHLFENNADHLEKVARSYGTRTTFKKTVRYRLGPLFTFLNTGQVSNREVEEFILHPNQLKSLAPRGQGYLLLPDRVVPLNFETLPRFDVPDWPLPKRRPVRGLKLDEIMEQKEKRAAS